MIIYNKRKKNVKWKRKVPFLGKGMENTSRDCHQIIESRRENEGNGAKAGELYDEREIVCLCVCRCTC